MSLLSFAVGLYTLHRSRGAWTESEIVGEVLKGPPTKLEAAREC